MKISKEDVKRVAELSKLTFSEEDLTTITNQLVSITDMMENLDNVDTTGVPFTSNVTEEFNVYRTDEVVKGVGRDALMSNVPEKQDGYIKVPAMIDNGEAGA